MQPPPQSSRGMSSPPCSSPTTAPAGCPTRSPACSARSARCRTSSPPTPAARTTPPSCSPRPSATERVLHLARRTGFGTAVDEAVRTARVLTPDDLPYLKRPSGWDPVSRTWRDDAYDMPELPHGEPVQWLWLLHDDCAPEPDALAELLRVVDARPVRRRHRRPQAARLVRPQAAARSRRHHRPQRPPLDRPGPPRTGPGPARPGPARAVRLHRRHAHPPRRLRGARRLRPPAAPDARRRRPVLARPGRRPPRPRRPGRRRCGTPRPPPASAAPSTASGRSVASPHRVDKAGAVYTLLANTRGAMLPYVLLRLVLGTLLRTLAYLVGKVPGQALDELAGLFGTLLRPGRILAARTQARPPRGRHERTAAALPAARRDRAGHRRAGRRQPRRAAPTPDVASAGRHGAVESGPGGDDADFLEIEQFARLKRIARKPGPVLFVRAAAGLAGRLPRAARRRRARGRRAAARARPTSSDLWSRYLDGWHPVGAGGTAVRAALPGDRRRWSSTRLLRQHRLRASPCCWSAPCRWPASPPTSPPARWSSPGCCGPGRASRTPSCPPPPARSPAAGSAPRCSPSCCR